jgi:hypothetical protein
VTQLAIRIIAVNVLLLVVQHMADMLLTVLQVSYLKIPYRNKWGKRYKAVVFITGGITCKTGS